MTTLSRLSNPAPLPVRRPVSHRSTVHSSIGILRKVYGWSCVVAGVTFFIFGQAVSRSEAFGFAPYVFFLGSFFAWFSLYWCLQHAKAIKEYAPNIALMVFSPFFAAGLDALQGTKLTPMLAASLLRIPYHLGFPLLDGPWQVAVVLSICFAVSVVFMYLTTWVLAGPVAFASFLLVAIPIWFARLVHSIDPKNNFFGFSIAVMLGVSWWLASI